MSCTSTKSDSKRSHASQGVPPGLLSWLSAQFGRPAGALGHLAGWLMARNDCDDQWIVAVLEVEAQDRVLDVGCGPGITVALAAERAVAGLTAGVDHSAAMLHQAARRNRAAIMANRVDLRLGTAQRLPYPDAYFTKVCAVHTIHFWSSVETGLSELHRVLAPGGRVVLALRMYRPEAGRFDPSRYGFTEAQIAAMTATLGAVGLRGVATQRRNFDRETITAVVAYR